GGRRTQRNSVVIASELPKSAGSRAFRLPPSFNQSRSPRQPPPRRDPRHQRSGCTMTHEETMQISIKPAFKRSYGFHMRRIKLIISLLTQ
ncbi:hypothetical protein OSTOST_15868, partial [Ostertagia ostertagi]